jgi:hypothetical protein
MANKYVHLEDHERPFILTEDDPGSDTVVLEVVFHGALSDHGILPEVEIYERLELNQCLNLTAHGSDQTTAYQRYNEVKLATCDCVVDQDGSTIEACRLHPKGGSPKSVAVWAAKAEDRAIEEHLANCLLCDEDNEVFCENYWKVGKFADQGEGN